MGRNNFILADREGAKENEPYAVRAYGSDTGRGQWTDIGDDSLTSYGNESKLAQDLFLVCEAVHTRSDQVGICQFA